MLSNFQEHFQHLQHLPFSSYFLGLQRKLPLSSLGYSHPRRHYHMASIRQANCYLEFFGFLKSRQRRWVRVFSTKPDYLDLIPRTYMVEQEKLLRKLSYGLYIHLVTQTPSSTHQINESRWKSLSQGSCQSYGRQCPILFSGFHMYMHAHVQIYTHTYTGKNSQTKLKYHHHSPETTFNTETWKIRVVIP